LDHKGTPRLFEKRFNTPNGRARFHAVDHISPAEIPDDEYPLYLTTGRVLAQYQTSTLTRRVKKLEEICSEPFAEIHPTTARRYDLTNGDMVTLFTRRGQAEFRIKTTLNIREDTVFVPFHWGGTGSANRLTNPALDPTSRMPEFKVCAVRIGPATERGAQEEIK
jgi:assimilatory nitrate reductase catalytic subunit